MDPDPSPRPATYRRAVAVLDEVVHAAPAMTWDDPSYCPPWTVRDLLGHVVAGQWTVWQLATARPVEPAEPVDPTASVGSAPELDDPVGAWERASQAALARLTPAALDREVVVDGRRYRLGDYLETRRVVEVLTHAWDLAHAADVGTTFDHGLAGYALDVARREHLDGDGAGDYGPPRHTHSAEPIDQLVAWLGRDVDAIVSTNTT